MHHQTQEELLSGLFVWLVGSTVVVPCDRGQRGGPDHLGDAEAHVVRRRDRLRLARGDQHRCAAEQRVVLRRGFPETSEDLVISIQ